MRWQDASARAFRSMTAIRPKAPSGSASRRPICTTLTPSPSEASTSSVLSPEPHSGRTPTAAGWSPGWLRGSMHLRQPIPAKDVQWLQVEAFQNSGTGIFSDVTFIQRVLTYGGQAPPSCDSDTTTSRRYAALYIFWAAGAAPSGPEPLPPDQPDLQSQRPGRTGRRPNLQNPWGLAFGPTNPLWVADNNAAVAIIYTVNAGGTEAAKRNLTVALPGGRASTGDGPSPTGQVFNPTTGFVVSSTAGTGPAAFIFSAEAGQISAWNSAADPVTNGMSTAQVVFSSETAVYKGLAIATTDEGTFLYASNFHDGTVDVFDSNFHQVQLLGDFRDRPSPPATPVRDSGDRRAHLCDLRRAGRAEAR